MESILTLSLTQNTSDLHLSSNEYIFIRQNGRLIKMNNHYLTAQQLQHKLMTILSTDQLTELDIHRQLDFAYSHSGYGRFRVNVFYQKRGLSATFRIIKSTVPTLDDISAPAIFKQFALIEQGLILITGATGSGKSTTLAAILEYINQYQAKHIITMEDPIEFVYQNKQSLIQQREVGLHCNSFLSAIMAVLRQDPDVIMMGELRNCETISAALQAAETGHVVFATLHTNSTIATINRIIDVFPDEGKSFIRAQLAQSLKVIIAQQLIDDNVSGRKAIFEILVNIPAISHLIHEGKIKQITSVMQAGAQFGMTMMPNQSS